MKQKTNLRNLILAVILLSLLIALGVYLKKPKTKTENESQKTTPAQESQEPKEGQTVEAQTRFSTPGQVVKIDYRTKEVVLKLENDDSVLQAKKGEEIKFLVLETANISDINNVKIEFNKIKEGETLLLLGKKEESELKADVVLVGGLPKPPGS